jgi:hypothetical protein
MADKVIQNDMTTTPNDVGISHGSHSTANPWDILRRDVQSNTRRNAVSVSKELMEVARERHREREWDEYVQRMFNHYYSRPCLNQCATWCATISACLTVGVLFLCVIAIAHVKTPSDLEFLKIPALTVGACWMCAIGYVGVFAYAIEVGDLHSAESDSNSFCKV